LIKGHFRATCSHLIYIVKDSKTSDMEGPISIIQKVTPAMFGSMTLNGQDCFKCGLLTVKVLVP